MWLLLPHDNLYNGLNIVAITTYRVESMSRMFKGNDQERISLTVSYGMILSKRAGREMLMNETTRILSY